MWVTNEGKEQGGPLAWMWICNFEIHPEDAFLWWWPKVLAIKQVVIPLNIYPEAGWMAREKIVSPHTDTIAGSPLPSAACWLVEKDAGISKVGGDCQRWVVCSPMVLFSAVFFFFFFFCFCASVAITCIVIFLFPFIVIFLFLHLFFKSSLHQLQYLRAFVTS